MPIYQYRCRTIGGNSPIKNPREFCAEEGHDVETKSPDEVEGYYMRCGHEYEVFYTSISKVETEEPLERCPKCGGTEKEKLVSQGTTHILKGPGWFKSGGY